MADSDLKDRSDQSVSDDQLRDITGISKDEERAMDERATAEEQSEASKLKDADDDTIGGGYKAPRRKRFQFTTRQKAAGGGIAGLLVGGAAGMMIFISGPLQLIHLAQVLEKNFRPNFMSTEKRWAKFSKYLGARDAASTRLTLKGKVFYNFTQKKLAAKGVNLTSSQRGLPNFEIDIDKFNGGELAGKPPTIQRLELAKFFDIDPGLIDHTVGSTTDTFRIRGNTLKGTEASRVLRFTIGTADEGRLLSAVRLRTLKNAFGVPTLFKQMRKVTYKQNANIELGTNWLKEVRRKFGARAAAKVPNKLTVATKSSLERLKNFGESPAGKAISLVGFGLEILCQVDNIIDDIPKVNWGHVVVPSIEEATATISVGSEIMASGILGDKSEVSTEEIAARVANLKDDQGKSVWEGKALNALANNTAGKGQDLKPEYMQAFTPLSNKEFLQKYLGDTFGSFGAGTIAVACSPVGKIANLVVGLGLTVFTFGSFTAAKLGTAAGKTALFSATMLFVSDQAIDLLTSDPVKGFAGEMGGNLLAWGSRSAQGSDCRMSGCVELSRVEEARVRREVESLDRQEFQQRNAFARVFDIKDHRSVASILLRETPSNASDISQNFASLLLSPVENLGNILGSILPNASAAEQYDYGMPMYGMPSSVMDDPDLDDPYANAEAAAVLFEKGDYIEKAKKCFGVKIFKGPEGWEAEQESLPSPADSEYMDADCDNVSDKDWRRVMMFVFDNKLMSSMSCYSGSDESECSKIGFSGSSSAAPAASTTAGNFIVGDPYTESVSVECAPGTRFVAIVDGYKGGDKIPTRLCAIDALPSKGSESREGSDYYVEGAKGATLVNSRVSGAWLALVNAAKKDGINLSATSTFRTMKHQQSLCDDNAKCKAEDYSGVAKPGNSPHQAAVAIDFDNMGDFDADRGLSCANRQTWDSPDYRWMRANASKFGFRQYVNESWHFDAYADDSRCA